MRVSRVLAGIASLSIMSFQVGCGDPEVQEFPISVWLEGLQPSDGAPSIDDAKPSCDQLAGQGPLAAQEAYRQALKGQGPLKPDEAFLALAPYAHCSEVRSLLVGEVARVRQDESSMNAAYLERLLWFWVRTDRSVEGSENLANELELWSFFSGFALHPVRPLRLALAKALRFLAPVVQRSQDVTLVWQYWFEVFFDSAADASGDSDGRMALNLLEAAKVAVTPEQHRALDFLCAAPLNAAEDSLKIQALACSQAAQL